MQSNLYGKKIIIAPLNWGLGHATRSIPIIRELIAQEAEVILAGDGAPLRFLKEVFPQLRSYELPSYQIEYPSGWGGAWKTVFQAPKIIQAIKDEHQEIEKIVDIEKIDYILSDHRYGVYSKKAKSIFIAHQLRVLPPKGLRWGAGIILAWHRTFLKHFDEIWVPDYEAENNLSGKLSHHVNTGVPTKYIGPQSRWNEMKHPVTEENIVVVLSGPEPQRTFFEQKLLLQLTKISKPVFLIRGVVQNGEIEKVENVTIINYLQSEELHKLLSTALFVISRPGYSSLIELSKLNKKILLIPTPGQTEQEYLAENLAQKKQAIVQKQSQLNIPSAIEQLSSITPIQSIPGEKDLLRKVLLSL